MVTAHLFGGFPCSFFQSLKWGESVLAEHSQEPESDALRCLEAVTKLSKTQVFSRFQDLISEVQWLNFNGFIHRRAAGEPLAYILGEAWFGDAVFLVEKGVLIPRHDTEIIVQESIRCCRKNQIQHVVECGFGSGIISISLAKAIPHLQISAWDISEIATHVATQNGQKHGVGISWQHGDFFEAQSQWEPLFQSETPTLFVSNPPYIPHDDIGGLEPQVRDHEPHLALDGGSDGLDYYRRFLSCLSESQKTWFVAEVGIHQKVSLTQLFEPIGVVSWTEDLQGIARVMTVSRP